MAFLFCGTYTEEGGKEGGGSEGGRGGEGTTQPIIWFGQVIVRGDRTIYYNTIIIALSDLVWFDLTCFSHTSTKHDKSNTV